MCMRKPVYANSIPQPVNTILGVNSAFNKSSINFCKPPSSQSAVKDELVPPSPHGGLRRVSTFPGMNPVASNDLFISSLE